MMTIFTIPKAFDEEFGPIQLAAIKSWLKLSPKPEIILFGNEKGVTKVANKYKLTHIKRVKKTNSGIPLLNDVFVKAQKYGKTRVYAFINADIIIKKGFMETVKRAEKTFTSFLLSGRRYEGSVAAHHLAAYSWADYFVFTKPMFASVPGFAIGRTFWDRWLFYYAYTNKIPVIDATLTITAVHQTHTYNHDKGGVKTVWVGSEAMNNVRVAGGWGNGASLKDAAYQSMKTKPYFIHRRSEWLFILKLRLRQQILNLIYRMHFAEKTLFALRFFSKSRLGKL